MVARKISITCALIFAMLYATGCEQLDHRNTPGNANVKIFEDYFIRLPDNFRMIPEDGISEDKILLVNGPRGAGTDPTIWIFPQQEFTLNSEFEMDNLFIEGFLDSETIRKNGIQIIYAYNSEQVGLENQLLAQAWVISENRGLVINIFSPYSQRGFAYEIFLEVINSVVLSSE